MGNAVGNRCQCSGETPRQTEGDRGPVHSLRCQVQKFTDGIIMAGQDIAFASLALVTAGENSIRHIAHVGKIVSSGNRRRKQALQKKLQHPRHLPGTGIIGAEKSGGMDGTGRKAGGGLSEDVPGGRSFGFGIVANNKRVVEIADFRDLPAILRLRKDMDTAYQLLTSTGGYKKSLFVADTSYEHFHYLPNTTEGETLLKLLVRPRLMKQLDQLLLSDLGSRQPDLPIDHDGVDASGNPAVLAYDFDLHRINRFNTGLNVYGRKGVMICFDFQIPCLKRYLTADIRFSSIDLSKFRKGFLHEP